MVKVGLVGCGRWGRLILRDLKTLGCHVAVVAHGPASRENAAAGGADEIVDAIADLPEVDGAVVATPTITHAETILKLLLRKIPVFCEKPLTSDVEAARTVVRQGGERVFVMDKWRYHKGVEMLAAIARSGELGPVLGIKSYRLGWGNPHDDVDLTWILLPHDLSIALEILSELPRPVRAVAEHDAHGLVSLTGWLEGTAWLIVEVGGRSPEHRRSVELRCRDGIAVLDDAYESHIRVLGTGAGQVGGMPSAWEKRPIAEDMPLRAELSAFVGYLSGGPAPRSSAREGLEVVEIIDQLRRLAGLNTS